MEKELLKGLVVKVYGLYYTVRFNDNEEINCVLRGKIRTVKKFKKFSNPVAVGDNVSFTINDNQTGTILEVLDRKNIFSRKDKGRGRKEDIIAANLDNIVIIQAFSHPPLNLRFVDRLAVRGQKEGIKTILCVNKYDEADEEKIQFIKDYYENTDLEIYFTSAKTGEGVDDFHKAINGKRSILSGYSGVGKSTILNKLYPGLELSTSEISEHSGKGRHTTTNVSLISLDSDTELLDTPGVREFGLVDVEPNELSDYFYEFQDYSSECHFIPCSHDHEPKCEIKKNVEDGNIHGERYHSYLNILYSLKEYQDNKY